MKITKITAILLANLLLFLSCSGNSPAKGGPEFVSVELDASNVKATYNEGEAFDSNGLIVYAVYSDGTKKQVEDYKIENASPLKKGSQTISVSCTVDGVIKYATLPVVVNGYEYTYYTTDNGTMLAPVFDLCQIGQRAYSYQQLKSEVKSLRDLGFSRIYIVTLNPGYPVFSDPNTAPSLGSYELSNIQLFGGDVNATMAKVCKELNMEAIAVFKPYENGGMLTVPTDAVVKESVYQEATVGGISMFYDSFASKNPEMKIARKNDYDENDYVLPITKIELEFMLDQYTDRAATGSKIVSAISDSGIKTPKINLWVSKNNGTYTLYDSNFTYNYKVENRTVYDVNGMVIGTNKKCNVLTITGINIGADYQYAAVTLEDSTGMRIIPYSMIRWYSGDRELKLTATTYVRTIDSSLNYVGQWTDQNLPSYNLNLTSLVVGSDGKVTGGMGSTAMTWQAEAVARFYKTGFVFSWFGVGHNGDGWKSTAILGLARGKAAYMGGSLCEAYPQVRQYWLDTVAGLLDAGYNGVDIRLQNHSTMTLDYMSYGFNEPIVQKYKELYGVDLKTVKMTQQVYLNMMKIRGDFFMQFYEDAAKLVHERNALLFIHLKAAHENPTCDTNWNQLCHWTMPKITLDWKRCVELADEITIKDYYYKNYQASAANAIKNYAASLGKKIWIHCYYQQGDALNDTFIQTIEKDSRISGIILYEAYFSGNFMTDVKAMLKKYNFSDHNS